jgi:DNA-binding NarL/FixJ family response regulator
MSHEQPGTADIAGGEDRIRIVIADDHPIVRAGLRAVLGTVPDFDVVAEASTAEEAIGLALRGAGAGADSTSGAGASAGGDESVPSRADLVLMDLSFGDGMSGIEATRAISGAIDAPRVLVLTNYDSDADILGAIEAGAAGYLLKDSPPDDLIAAIRSAVAGRSVLGPAVATRLVARVSAPQTALSAREIEVLANAAEGLTNQAIAARLHVSETTIKSHLAHIYTKLDVTNRSSAIAAAQRQGLFRPR